MTYKAKMSQDELNNRFQHALNLPFHRFLELELLESRPGFCKAQVNHMDHTINVNDVVHGGIIYSVLDFAAYAALLPILEDSQTAATADIHCSVMRPAPTDHPLIFVGKITKFGKRLAFCDSEAYYKETLIASARLTKSIIDLKPLPG